MTSQTMEMTKMKTLEDLLNEEEVELQEEECVTPCRGLASAAL